MTHRGRAIGQVNQDQPGVDQVERLRRRRVADHVVPARPLPGHLPLLAAQPGHSRLAG
jgi:hypothetical protein